MIVLVEDLRHRTRFCVDDVTAIRERDDEEGEPWVMIESGGDEPMVVYPEHQRIEIVA